MLLWANLHGSFAFGLALAAALGAEAVYRQATGSGPRCNGACSSAPALSAP